MVFNEHDEYKLTPEALSFQYKNSKSFFSTVTAVAADSSSKDTFKARVLDESGLLSCCIIPAPLPEVARFVARMPQEVSSRVGRNIVRRSHTKSNELNLKLKT